MTKIKLRDYQQECLDTIITKARTANKDKLVTIVVDSISAATSENETAADFSKEGWATDKAIVISKAMRKITQLIARQRVCLFFVQQLREKLGVMFGDKSCVEPYTTKVKIRYRV